MGNEIEIRDRAHETNTEKAWDLEGASLPFRARPEPELFSSREVTIQFRGPALKCDALREPRGVAELVRKILRDDSKEHFLAIYLDARHRPLAHSVVSIGTATASLVHPREVFQPALHLGAVALIVAHNHPSGDPRPSGEDKAVTSRLGEVGKLLGVTLVDSVIVTREGEYHSFRESNPGDFV